MEITKEQILKIVDQCFHSYASSFRNEARQEATILIDKHLEAINYTRCCTELPTNSEMNVEINKEYATWDKENCADMQSFGCGFKTGAIWNHNKNKK